MQCVAMMDIHAELSFVVVVAVYAWLCDTVTERQFEAASAVYSVHLGSAAACYYGAFFVVLCGNTAPRRAACQSLECHYDSLFVILF